MKIKKLIGKRLDKRFNKKYSKHKFKKIEDAKKKQAFIKKRYGYTPNILKVSNRKTNKFENYVIIQPKNMKPIKKEK